MTDRDTIIKAMECHKNKKVCMNHCPYCDGTGDFEECTNKLIADAHDLLVKSKPQTGYWSISDYEYLDCSCCGNSYYTGCESKSEAQRRLDGGFFFKWCPYCGARMTNKNP